MQPIKGYQPRPEPPEGPPNRTFKDVLFFGLVETKKSKQSTRDWQNYMRGYRAGLSGKRTIKIPPGAE